MEFRRIPQCKQCVPELWPKNSDALRLWLITENQVIVGGMGGVFGVNQLAVWQAIERYGVREPVKTFEKVLRLWSEITSEEFSADES